MEKKSTSLKQWQIYGYGFAGMFLNTFMLMFLAYYLLFYLTNVWGFSAIAAAAIYNVAMWLRTGTMVAAGIAVDSVSLPWGKYRSWLYIGSILSLIGSALMFTNLGIGSQTLAVGIFFVVYTVSQFGYNSMWVSQRALIGKMSKNANDAIGLTSAAQMMSSLGGILYGLVGVIILGMWGSQQAGYTYTAILYSSLIVIGCILMATLTKKFDPPISKEQAASGQRPERIGIIAMLKNLKGPMIPYFISMTIGNAQLGFFFALLTYYTTYVLKDPAAFGLSITLSSVFAVFGAYAAQPLCKKFSKKSVWIVVMVITGVLYGLITLIGRTSLPFLILRSAIGFIGSFIGVLLPALANDISDYNEMNGQKNARAFVQSMAGTTIRFGSVISAFIASFGLAFVGFEAGMEITPEILNGITNLMALGPALVSFIAAGVFVFYKVDEKALDHYRSQKEAMEKVS